MISVDEAIAAILREKAEVHSETVDLSKATGRLLMEDIFSDTDLPPFDRVMMDGIAIRFSDFEKGTREFLITDIQRAGESQKTLFTPDTCLEVMTGAVCPAGADLVVPYEDIEIKDGKASLQMENLLHGKNIHPKGRDHKKGDLLLAKSCLLNAPRIGIAASVGKNNILVAAAPRIHIFSTGDELVEVSQTPESFQIRRSNVHALQALLTQHGFSSTQSHIRDEEHEIKERLHSALQGNDVVLLTGGVSKGKFDLIPSILQELGAVEIFHRIAQKPGKPMWFGRHNNTLVFAFPGNPVSTLVCAVRYLIPWIKANYQMESKPIHVQLSTKSIKKIRLTQFLPVRISLNEDGFYSAELIPNNGSGDFSALANTDGFVEISPDFEIREPMTWVPFFSI